MPPDDTAVDARAFAWTPSAREPHRIEFGTDAAVAAGSRRRVGLGRSAHGFTLFAGFVLTGCGLAGGALKGCGGSPAATQVEAACPPPPDDCWWRSPTECWINGCRATACVCSDGGSWACDRNGVCTTALCPQTVPQIGSPCSYTEFCAYGADGGLSGYSDGGAFVWTGTVACGCNISGVWACDTFGAPEADAQAGVGGE
jgi:hypothetical protein